MNFFNFKELEINEQDVIFLLDNGISYNALKAFDIRGMKIIYAISCFKNKMTIILKCDENYTIFSEICIKANIDSDIYTNLKHAASYAFFGLDNIKRDN